jgi:hypothetical protein
LLLLIFPTDSAVAERGFAQMCAVHNKQLLEMTTEPVWLYMLVLYNGPTLAKQLSNGGGMHMSKSLM